MIIKKLKGGSLSSTELHEENNRHVIKKRINFSKEREYGFMRWYSQLKKIQKYYTEFPDLFPRIYNISYDKDNVILTLEYFAGYEDVKTILSKNDLDKNQIKNIVNAIWKAFNRLHSKAHFFIDGSPTLYYNEEVKQKLKDAMLNVDFAEFCKKKEYIFDGEKIFGIYNYLDNLEKFFTSLKISSEENIHGNPTLENILYSFEENKVIFIDLYEESMMDSKYLDYAQILQCSRSHYGYINDRDITVDKNAAYHTLTIPNNFIVFNKLFEQKLPKKYKKLIDVLEATQFIRMLPFKCRAGEIEKAKFFYLMACKLLADIFKNGKYTN